MYNSIYKLRATYIAFVISVVYFSQARIPIKKEKDMSTPMLIGIAGGTGSGKSTFAQGLKRLFPDEITIISYDNYYKPQDHLSMEERVKTNYDCPDALDTDLLVKHQDRCRTVRRSKSPITIFAYIPAAATLQPQSPHP